MNNKPEPFDEIEAAERPQPRAEAGGEPTKEQPVSARPDSDKTPSPFGPEPDAWEKKAAEYLAGWKRAQADYQNLRKSVEQEKVDMVKYANEALLQDLVPLMDHFNMAFKSVSPADQNSAWLKGIQHIATNFKQVLLQYGVSLIPTVGRKFDPSQHESVGEVASTEPEGMVVEEVHTGFMLHGKVMQPAKVKISTGKSK